MDSPRWLGLYNDSPERGDSVTALASPGRDPASRLPKVDKLRLSNPGAAQAVGRSLLLIHFVHSEREGFEPSMPCGIHAFQACALDQLCDLSIWVRTFFVYMIPVVFGKLETPRSRWRRGALAEEERLCLGSFDCRFDSVGRTDRDERVGRRSFQRHSLGFATLGQPVAVGDAERRNVGNDLEISVPLCLLAGKRAALRCQLLEHGIC